MVNKKSVDRRNKILSKALLTEPMTVSDVINSLYDGSNVNEK